MYASASSDRILNSYLTLLIRACLPTVSFKLRKSNKKNS